MQQLLFEKSIPPELSETSDTDNDSDIDFEAMMSGKNQSLFITSAIPLTRNLGLFIQYV